MLGITRRAEDRRKPGVDEESGMVISRGYFKDTWGIRLYGTEGVILRVIQKYLGLGTN